MADSRTTVESGSTSGAWAETTKLSSAAQLKATSSSAPSFVRRRSTSSSASSSRPGPDKAESPSTSRQRPEALKPAATRQPSSAKVADVKIGSSEADALAVGEEPENYRPKLSRIREDKERERDASYETKRGSSRSQSRDRARDRGVRRRIVPSEDIGINSGHVYRRGVRHRSGQSAQLQRQLTSIANASVLSVLSSLTAASSASSGSNSTITQKRYDNGQGYRKRRRKPGQRDSEGEESSGNKQYSTSTRRKRAAMDEDRLSHSYPVGSVVSYAPPNWQPQPRPHSTAGYGDSLYASGPVKSTQSNHSNSAAHMDRTNSDSGISMRDTSPEAVEKLPKLSPVVRHDSVLEQTEQEPDEDYNGSSGSGSDEEEEAELSLDVSQYQVASHDDDRHLREQLSERQGEASSHILQSPQPRRYHSFTLPRYDVQPGVQHMPYQDMHHPQAYPQRRMSMAGSQTFAPRGSHGHHQPVGAAAYGYIEDDPLRVTKIGYELLANKLVPHADDSTEAGHETSLAPLYRRFDFLNHRVLLHLQDELAELEEELRRVDEMIARQQGQYVPSESNQDDKDLAKPQRTPTSRREEVSSGDELCERRSNILGRIYTRLKQYNKALSSYRNATTGFVPASGEEIKQYQSWMDLYKPVDGAEANFLNFKQDLMAIRTQHPAVATSQNNLTPATEVATGAQKLAVIAVLTCIPMLLFAIAPNVYAQAAVVLGTAMLASLLASSMSNLLHRVSS